MTDILIEKKLSKNSKPEDPSAGAMLNSQGFTLLEVIIALAIMVLAFSSILAVEGGSINASARAKKMVVVGMLAKNQMIEEEFKIQGKTFDEIPKEESGTFAEPFQDYRWKATVSEIEFPKLASLSSNSNSNSQDSGEDQFAETINKLMTNFLSKALREVTVTILWAGSGGKNSATPKDQTFSLTTYWVDLNYEFSLSE